MRILAPLAFLALVGALPAAAPSQRPRLQLSDDELPIWEIRPLDRRVHCLTLDGAWRGKPVPGATYTLNIRFPDGKVYTHTPLNDVQFRRGDIVVALQEYLLMRHKVNKKGKLTIYVTERLPGGTPEVISNKLTVRWPMHRPYVTKAPRTKRTPKPPIDDLPVPD
jgi:hypothetical protein